MTPDNRIQRVSEQLKAEVKDKARQRAEEVFGTTPAGTTDMSQKAFMDMVRRNWPDPSYREGLLTRVGAENFRDIVIQLHGGNEAVWPMPPQEAPIG